MAGGRRLSTHELSLRKLIVSRLFSNEEMEELQAELDALRKILARPKGQREAAYATHLLRGIDWKTSAIYGGVEQLGVGMKELLDLSRNASTGVVQDTNTPKESRGGRGRAMSRDMSRDRSRQSRQGSRERRRGVQGHRELMDGRRRHESMARSSDENPERYESTARFSENRERREGCERSRGPSDSDGGAAEYERLEQMEMTQQATLLEIEKRLKVERKTAKDARALQKKAELILAAAMEAKKDVLAREVKLNARILELKNRGGVWDEATDAVDASSAGHA